MRISEGWVRCGQCKEVFDAAANLLPAPPPALLPDVSLTDVRPQPAPVARRSDAGRAWGDTAPLAHRPVVPAKPVVAPAAPLYAAEDFSLLAPAPSAESGVDVAPALAVGASVPATPQTAHDAQPGPDRADPVLAVPDPAVPAFLAAGLAAGQHQAGDLQLEPLTPFAWRARDASAAPKTVAPADGASGGQRPAAPTPTERAPTEGAAAGAGAVASPVALAAPMAAPLPRVPAPSIAVPGDAVVPPLPGGYELPFADLRDEDDPLDMPAFESTVPAELTPMGYPALELPIRPVVAPPESVPATQPDVEEATPSQPSMPSAKERSADALPPVDFIEQPEPAQTLKSSESSDEQGLALVEDDSPAAVLQAKPRKALRDGAADDGEPEPQAAEEVSFVVAARRKAFWRKPAVRAVLAVVALAATTALALQVAVQERDRIVAMDARARPWLMKLCAPLQCEIAPRRQIADVVIDSSSFNKARGDSYQLTLAMKSKANIPLAMPAVELTLTDAQDQPVLRRVLLPADMGAPAELSARGEWSTAVSAVVTTGGARVAGYRLLAFYP